MPQAEPPIVRALRIQLSQAVEAATQWSTKAIQLQDQIDAMNRQMSELAKQLADAKAATKETPPTPKP